MCTLLVKCPDKKGVIAALAQLLYGLGCNIVESGAPCLAACSLSCLLCTLQKSAKHAQRALHTQPARLPPGGADSGARGAPADQFTDNEAGAYFQRIRADYSELVVGAANGGVLEVAVGELAGRFGMTWQVFYDDRPKRVAVLVSRMDHCLYDLLIRHQRGELRCELPVVVSNHADLAHVAAAFGVEFRHLPIGGAGPEAKAAQEAAIESTLAELRIDLLVLARYMQIFSEGFCARHAMRTIDIHHSFLPAFEGAAP